MRKTWTTEGRGARAWPGAGVVAGRDVVREEGLLRVEGAVLARVLHGDEHGAFVVVDDRAAGLGVARDGEELLHAAALGAVEGDLEQPVGVADAGGAPSVEIQRLPTESNARLSGQEIGETWSAGKPAK